MKLIFSKIIIFLGIYMMMNINLLDASVTREWTKIMGTANWDRGYGVASDLNGNIYFTGGSEGNFDDEENKGLTDIFLTKYSSSGEKQWTKLEGTDKNQLGVGVVTDKNGNVYVVGQTSGALDGQVQVGDNDVFLIKYNSNGEKLWTRLFGTTGNDEGVALAIDDDSNIYITGFMKGDFDDQTHLGETDIFLVKYSSNGERMWSRLLGTSGYDVGYGITLDKTGDVYITGFIEVGLAPSEFKDVFLAKYSSIGERLWAKLLNATDDIDSIGKGVAVDINGNIYVTGITYGNLDGHISVGNTDLFLMKYNSSLVKQWTKLIGTVDFDGDDAFGSNMLFIDNTGNLYSIGSTRGDLNGETNSGNWDVFLMKYSLDGALIWTKLIGGTSSQYGVSLTGDNNGNIYITGDTYESIHGELFQGVNDAFLIKYHDTLSGEKVGFIDITQTTEFDFTQNDRNIQVVFQEGSLSENVYLTADISAISESILDGVNAIGLGVDLTLSKEIELSKSVTITIDYKESDIGIANESDFYLGRYDETTNTWVALSSTVDKVNNLVTATTDHLSKFAILVKLETEVYLYPNPYKPLEDDGILKIKNVTGTVSLKVYTIAGKLVYKKESDDSNFIVTWDGKNNDGQKVSSGVYIIVVKDDIKKTKHKVGLIR